VSQSNLDLERLSAELVVYAGRLVRAVSRRTSQGLPAATLRLLSQLEELGPITIGQLAVADRCSQPTMSSAVNSLVAKGWAVKKPNPADARSSLVAETDIGRDVLTKARHRNAAVIAEQLRSNADRDPDESLRDLATAVSLIKRLLDEQPSNPDNTERVT
jgi:DNA-binding MarR family transcriptional regulator